MFNINIRNLSYFKFLTYVILLNHINLGNLNSNVINPLNNGKIYQNESEINKYNLI